MTKEILRKIFNEEIPEKVKDILGTKGEVYPSGDDALGNFKRGAIDTELPIEKVWQIYFCKHYDAIKSYVKGIYKDSEPIEGRIIDAIVYLGLLYAIVREKKTDSCNEGHP